MATATRTRTTRTKAATKPAPEPVVEEIEDDELEDEVEELDEDSDDTEDAGDEDETDEVDPPVTPEPVTPKRTKTAAAPAAETKGTAWLTDHVNEQAGTNYSGSALRILLRKLVKDGVLSREIGTDRSRYDFSGPKDPIVVAVVKAVKDGDLAAERKASLDKVKAAAAAKKEGAAASAPKATTTKRAKAKPVAEPEVIEDDFDEDDVEDL